MGSLLSAISNDYHDYKIFCKVIGKEPLNLYNDNNNFYRTNEWNQVKEIPKEGKGCLRKSNIRKYLEGKTK